MGCCAAQGTPLEYLFSRTVCFFLRRFPYKLIDGFFSCLLGEASFLCRSFLVLNELPNDIHDERIGRAIEYEFRKSFVRGADLRAFVLRLPFAKVSYPLGSFLTLKKLSHMSIPFAASYKQDGCRRGKEGNGSTWLEDLLICFGFLRLVGRWVGCYSPG